MANIDHPFAGKKILLSGASGYLAASLMVVLKKIRCDIIRLGRPGTKLAPIVGTAAAKDQTGDIRERSTWEQAVHDVDLVYHLAAQTSVRVANENPSVDLESNVLPMLHLLESCRRQAICPSIVFASTVTAMGIPQCLPVAEEHHDDPVTIYDLHKLMAEQYLRYYASQGLVRGVSLRLANVYGSGPRSSSPDRGVLNQMVHKALKGESLTVYGTGEAVRDYVYIDDVTRAFVAAGSTIECMNGQYFVIGSGQGHTIAEAADVVADQVAVKTGRSVGVQHIDPPQAPLPIDARHFVADTRHFSQSTGWKAQVSLVEGIERTIDAFLMEEGDHS